MTNSTKTETVKLTFEGIMSISDSLMHIEAYINKALGSTGKHGMLDSPLQKELMKLDEQFSLVRECLQPALLVKLNVPVDGTDTSLAVDERG